MAIRIMLDRAGGDLDRGKGWSLIKLQHRLPALGKQGTDMDVDQISVSVRDGGWVVGGGGEA